MPQRLPPLRTLQVFEAAARHLGYGRAADELCLTQSAVSHQIKALEHGLRAKLFRRAGRSMVLTDAGARLHAQVRNGLACFAQGLEELRADGRPEVLTIGATPSVAAGWLVPRLPDFYRRHPEIDVNLRATNALVDFQRDDVDLALRYGPGVWPGLRAEKLLTVDIFPVCSPSFRCGSLPKKASDLPGCALLHYTYGTSWEEWFKSSGVALRTPLRGSRFDNYGLAVQAAVDGQGVLLGRDALVAKELAERRLVRLLQKQPAQRAFNYYIVYPEGAELPRKALAFRDWLRQQAATSGR